MKISCRIVCLFQVSLYVDLIQGVTSSIGFMIFTDISLKSEARIIAN